VGTVFEEVMRLQIGAKAVIRINVKCRQFCGESKSGLTYKSGFQNRLWFPSLVKKAGLSPALIILQLAF
jgi:hypothetical protein